VLRHALLTAVTGHFLAYGHSMIFVQKAFDLLDRIGWQEADAVLSPLVPEMVLGTRYDAGNGAAAGAPVAALIGSTGRAAAERLARFDIELDLDDTNDWGWTSPIR
jgi:hypothetical protein